MGVKLLSSSGGSVEIAAPVTASNYVLTAPAASGMILNDQSSLAAANLTGNIASARITSALNASGSAPIYACRAWVNFNGTGTVAIRASGNVSSITDNGTGDYTVNFTTAMPDANYALAGASTNTGVVWMQALGFLSSTGQPTLKTTTQARLYATYTGGSIDTEISAVFFR